MKNLTEILQQQHINHLLDKTNEDWGDVEENIARTVRTGIPTLDGIIYGYQDELAGIIGPSGSRKTTFMLNTFNYNAHHNPDTPQVYITVESGMRPERIRDAWIAMRATEYLRTWRDEDNLPHGTLPYLFTDFFKYHKPNEIQQDAIGHAIASMAGNNAYILGTGASGGSENSRNYEEIFDAIASELGYCVVYIDHLHAIYSGQNADAYGHIIEVTSLISYLMKKHNLTVVMAVQPSMSSMQRNSMEARGGSAFREECTTYLNVAYKRVPQHSIEIFVDKSRKSVDKFKVDVPIEPASGLFIGDGTLISSTINLDNMYNQAMNLFDEDW